MNSGQQLRGVGLGVGSLLLWAAASAAGCEFRLAFVHAGADGAVSDLARLGDGNVPPDRGPRPEGFVEPDAAPPPSDGPLVVADKGPGASCAKGCTTPPAPRCIDGKTQRRYDALGACVGGVCVYAEQTTTCSGSCVGGSCLKSGTLLHVDGRNGGAEAGTPQAPYRTISGAIAKAGSNTAILVAAGNYNEKLTIQNKVLELVGGYAGGSAADYAGGTGGNFGAHDPVKNVTTIAAAAGGPALTLTSAGASLVAGFTITGPGRGVDCSGGAPTLATNRITGHSTPGSRGAGVYAAGCNLTLLDNVIEKNIGSRGGGVSTEGGKLLFQGNLFKDNEGREDHGGGMYLVGADVELRDNRMEGNKVGLTLGYGWGGGVAFINCQAKLSGNVATGNRATTYGGAVFVDDGSVATLDNELYFANLCGDGGAGLYIDGLDSSTRSTATLINVTVADHNCSGPGNGALIDKSLVTIRNSIFWNNGSGDVVAVNGSSLTVSYTNAGQKLAGTGNTAVNPLFAGSGAGAYHLSSKTGRWDGGQWVKDAQSSPCIDAGDPGLGVGNGPAPNGGRGNLGAFGRGPTASKSP